MNSIQVEILPVKECAMYLGQTTNAPATGDYRDQESSPGRLCVVLQLQTSVDIIIVPPVTQTSLIQQGDHSDANFRTHLLTYKATAPRAVGHGVCRV